MNRKGKKNPILVYPGLRYTHKKLNFACNIFFSKKVCLNTKINLRLKKPQKKVFWGNFKNTSQKNQKNIWKLYD